MWLLFCPLLQYLGCDGQTVALAPQTLVLSSQPEYVQRRLRKITSPLCLTLIFDSPRVFCPTLPRGNLVFSALLCFHEALLLVARGFYFCVGGVVGVVSELNGWPVVRSPLWEHRPQSAGMTSPTADHPPDSAGR